MKIEAVSAKFPSRIISLEDTLKMIKDHSTKSYQGDLDKALRIIKKILLFSGANNRRWLDKNEKPITFIKDAVAEVLQKSQIKKEDVGLLIYTGIGRGFTEPGQSYIVAKNLGMNSVECFDILDACMSWTRALNIADTYLKSNQYKNILIVNGEFNSVEGEAFFPENYKLSALEQIKWTFPSYTLGDAASATLVSSRHDQDLKWNFLARSDLADICTIPTQGFSIFSEPYEMIGKNDIGRFCSFGNEMHKEGTPLVMDLLSKARPDRDEIKMIFPHASSKQAWAYCAEECGVEDKVYYVYPEYGNLVSASVPSGIALAFQEKKISEGDKIIIWVGSAGMSFATAEIEL